MIWNFSFGRIEFRLSICFNWLINYWFIDVRFRCKRVFRCTHIQIQIHTDEWPFFVSHRSRNLKVQIFKPFIVSKLLSNDRFNKMWWNACALIVYVCDIDSVICGSNRCIFMIRFRHHTNIFTCCSHKHKMLYSIFNFGFQIISRDNVVNYLFYTSTCVSYVCTFNSQIKYIIINDHVTTTCSTLLSWQTFLLLPRQNFKTIIHGNQKLTHRMACALINFLRKNVAKIEQYYNVWKLKTLIKFKIIFLSNWDVKCWNWIKTKTLEKSSTGYVFTCY